MYELYPPVTQLSAADAGTLRRTAKWARFIGIVGLVGAGLLIVLALFINGILGTVMDRQLDMTGVEMPFDLRMIGTFYAIGMFFAAALYFVPALLLYQFGSRTLRSLSTGFEPEHFSGALQAHRRFYKFMGIVTMIMLALYGVFFISIFIGVAAGAWMK